MRQRWGFRMGAACAAACMSMVLLGGVAQADGTAPVKGPKVSGDPVPVGVIYTAGVAGLDLPQILAGAEAAAKYVNAELGGVGGRPLKLVPCNDKAEPSRAADCARTFVDAGVIAVAGLSPLWGANGLPIIEAAGIPFVGTPISNEEFLSPASHPFGGGALTALPALVKYLVEDKGIKSASVLYSDIAVAQAAAVILTEQPLKAAGVEDVKLVPEKLGAADFTPAVVQATQDNPDALIVLFSSQDCGRILKAARQLGYQGDLAAPFTCTDDLAIETAGADAADGLIANSETSYLDKSKDAKTYRDRTKRYAGGSPDAFGAASFSQIVTLDSIADGIVKQTPDGLDAAAVTGVLATPAVKVFMGDAYDPTNPIELAGAKTAASTRGQRILQVKKGKFIDVARRWVNGFE